MFRQVNITDILYQDKICPDYISINKRKKEYFCPYCNEVKKFKRDRYLGVDRCTICGISVRDYYVKRCNKLEVIR